VESSSKGRAPIEILASNTGVLQTYSLDYHEGMRYPHLQRAPGTVDYIEAIFKPLTTNSVAKR
jgi:hypothetical protein